eukprot:g7627.t1
MATLGEGEGEPLDGENGSYRSDGEGEEYDASTTDGNEEPVAVAAAAPFPESELRESLGFLRAKRRLALPGTGFDKGSDDGSVVALAVLDVFGLLLVSTATGILVYGTEALSSAAFAAASSGAAPAARADVTLGGRPSCMAATEDNSRVAVALGDKVLIFDTASLAGGGDAPLHTLSLSSTAPPRALSWGRPAVATGDHDHLLLVVRADKKAIVARVGGRAAAALVVEDVADGRQEFTAGCFVGRGSRRLALGTCGGGVEVYGYGEGGGGLGGVEGRAPRPAELEMTGDAEVDHLAMTQTGSLMAVYYDSTAGDVQDCARLAEFDLSCRAPTLKAYEDPGLSVFAIEPAYESPESVKFRSQISLVTLEGEHLVLVTHNTNSFTPTILTTEAGGDGVWQQWTLDEEGGWDNVMEHDVFPRGLCFSECSDAPVPAQTKPQRQKAEAFGAGPLALMLTTKGELECSSLVHPMRPLESLRRNSAIRPRPLPPALESAVAAAAAANDDHEGGERGNGEPEDEERAWEEEEDAETEGEEGDAEEDDEEGEVKAPAPAPAKSPVFGSGGGGSLVFGTGSLVDPTSADKKDGAKGVGAAFGGGGGIFGAKSSTPAFGGFASAAGVGAGGASSFGSFMTKPAAGGGFGSFGKGPGLFGAAGTAGAAATGEEKKEEKAAAPAFPPMSTKAPSVFGGRRAIPSTAAEGLAWKNVLEVLEHLRELREQGEAGPLRDPAWADGMERGVEGIRDTIGRLRLAVADLGKDTADEVTEVATLKANQKDIRWQTTAAQGLLKEDEDGDGDGEEEGAGDHFGGGDDGRDPLDPELVYLRKSIRKHRRNIEAGMSDLQATLKSRRERRADLDLAATPGRSNREPSSSAAAVAGVGGEVTPGREGPGAPAAVAERPGLRLMRIVGSQYDATVAVEAWVAKAEAKVKQLERAKAAAKSSGGRHSAPVSASAAAGGAIAPSSSAITVHQRGKREDVLTRGRRLRRERDGLLLLAKEASRLSFSFPQREVGRTVTQDELAERLGNKPASISTPQQQQQQQLRTPSRLVTSGRGPGSLHQPSSTPSRQPPRGAYAEASSPSVAAAGAAAAAKINSTGVTATPTRLTGFSAAFSPPKPPPAAAAAAASTAGAAEVYTKFKPDNVPKIERLLVKYANNEWKMIEGILKKYGALGVGPPAGWSPPPAAGGTAPAASTPAPSGFGQPAQPAFGQASAFGGGGGTGFGQQQQQQQQRPFGQAAPNGFGAGAATNAFGAGAPAPASSPFGGGGTGFGAPSALGGGSVFGAPAAAGTAAAAPAAGGFSAFASGSQPSFGAAAAAAPAAGGGFAGFASQGGGGFGAAAASGSSFGGGGSTTGGGFSGSSFRQMRG